MLIYTLWERETATSTNLPWLVDAVDEYTIDELGEAPESYRERLKNPNVRELVIDIKQSVVENLFDPPVTPGEVHK